jgi:hypothetical protein
MPIGAAKSATYTSSSAIFANPFTYPFAYSFAKPTNAANPAVAWLSWRVYVRMYGTLSGRSRRIPGLCERLCRALLFGADATFATLATVPSTDTPTESRTTANARQRA